MNASSFLIHALQDSYGLSKLLGAMGFIVAIDICAHELAPIVLISGVHIGVITSELGSLVVFVFIGAVCVIVVASSWGTALTPNGFHEIETACRGQGCLAYATQVPRRIPRMGEHVYSLWLSLQCTADDVVKWLWLKRKSRRND